MDESPPDEEIIARVRQGQADAFEILIKRYERYVFGVLRKHLPSTGVQEVAHDVFVQAFRSLAGYKAASPFKHWLATIAVRSCYKYWRARDKERREVTQAALSPEALRWVECNSSRVAEEQFADNVSAQEASEVLHWAFSRMPAEDRVVLTLVHLEERSVKEAATLLGWSVANVKIRAFRARKRLERMVKQLPE